MNIVVIAILVVTLIIAAVLVAGSFFIFKAVKVLNVFVRPESPDKPSPMAIVLGTFSDMMARSIVAQAKATFMGKQSGMARAETAVTADIAEDTLNQVNPAFGAILSSFPALKKTLRRNPGLADIALSKLGSMLSNPGNGSKPGASQSPRFNL